MVASLSTRYCSRGLEHGRHRGEGGKCSKRRGDTSITTQSKVKCVGKQSRLGVVLRIASPCSLAMELGIKTLAGATMVEIVIRM